MGSECRTRTTIAALQVSLALLAACSSQEAKVLGLRAGGSSGDAGRPGAETSADATAASKILFSDDFSLGYANAWQVASGDGPVTDATDAGNPIVVLDASANDFSRLRCNSGGDKFTAADLVASVRLRVDVAPPSSRTVRLDVRQSATSQNIFYAVGATVNKKDGSITAIGLYKKVDDGTATKNYTICDLATTPVASPIPMGNWVSLKVALSGSTSVHLSGTLEYLGATVAVGYDDDCVSPLTSTADNRVPNGGCLEGQAGLGIQVEGGIKASADDVLVEAL
jgi:hypothetical protein